MNVVPSTIEFRGYRVNKAQFGLTGTQLAEGETVRLNPSFTRTIKKTGENAFSLELGVKLGPENDANALPFFTELIIEGYFVIDNPEDAETIMKVNGVAILFPYLRTTPGTPHLSEQRLKGRMRCHDCVGLAPNTAAGMRRWASCLCRSGSTGERRRAVRRYAQCFCLPHAPMRILP